MNNKQNPGLKVDNKPKLKECEHKSVVDTYLESLKMYKEGTHAWVEIKNECYYVIFWYCYLELQAELKSLTHWDAAILNAKVM